MCNEDDIWNTAFLWLSWGINNIIDRSLDNILEEKEKSARISHENGFELLYVYPETGELEMEEWRETTIKQVLQRVGGYSQICNNWEIYKLLFILHNVSPVWIEHENIAIDLTKVKLNNHEEDINQAF